MPIPPAANLVTGPAELLVRRRVEDLIATLRAEVGEVEVDRVTPEDVRAGGLGDLRTASLFAAPRVVVLRDVHSLGATVAGDLAAAVEAGLADQTWLIATASSTGSIRKLSAAIKASGAVHEAKPPPDWKIDAWHDLAADELRRADRAATHDAVVALVDRAGTDPDRIASAASQIAAQAPPGRLSVEAVEAVLDGHGSQGAFALADAVVERDPQRATELLAGLFAGGAEPIVVMGALAFRLRALVAVAAGLQSTDDFTEVGMRPISPGQARRLARIRRGFGPGELTAAYRVLADADADLRGSDVPPRLVVERAVVAIATPG